MLALSLRLSGRVLPVHFATTGRGSRPSSRTNRRPSRSDRTDRCRIQLRAPGPTDRPEQYRVALLPMRCAWEQALLRQQPPAHQDDRRRQGSGTSPLIMAGGPHDRTGERWVSAWSGQSVAAIEPRSRRSRSADGPGTRFAWERRWVPRARPRVRARPRHLEQGAGSAALAEPAGYVEWFGEEVIARYW